MKVDTEGGRDEHVYRGISAAWQESIIESTIYHLYLHIYAVTF